jgi:hypothetical protein
MPGVLTDLQNFALGLMKSDPYYARITLLSEQLGDIANRIQIALGKLGICAIALTPEATVKHTNAPGPILDPIRVSIDVVEFVLKNRGDQGSKQAASDVAEHTAWLLHYPNHAGRRSDPCILTAERLRIIPDKQFLIYRIDFTTAGALAGITEES